MAMKFQPISAEQKKDLELRHRYEDDGRIREGVDKSIAQTASRNKS